MNYATQFRNRHRPKTIQDIVWPTDNARDVIIKEYVQCRSIQPLLLHGPAGTGKTEIASLLPFAMWPGYSRADLRIEIGSKKSGTLVLRSIENELDLVPSGSFMRTLLVDEVEAFKPEFQKEFRGLINSYENDVFFIFTTNDLDSIEPPLRSRCRAVCIDRASSADRWLARAQAILKQQDVEISDEDLLDIITAANGQGRKILEGLFSYICRVKPPEPLDLEKIAKERPPLIEWSD